MVTVAPDDGDLLRKETAVIAPILIGNDQHFGPRLAEKPLHHRDGEAAQAADDEALSSQCPILRALHPTTISLGSPPMAVK